MRQGCEPSLGDIGCIDNDDQEDYLPQHFNRLLQIENFDLKIRPNELEQMVIDLSVNKSEGEMRNAEKEYKRMKFFREAKAEEIPAQRREANADFGV